MTAEEQSKAQQTAGTMEHDRVFYPKWARLPRSASIGRDFFWNRTNPRARTSEGLPLTRHEKSAVLQELKEDSALQLSGFSSAGNPASFRPPPVHQPIARPVYQRLALIGPATDPASSALASAWRAVPPTPPSPPLPVSVGKTGEAPCPQLLLQFATSLHIDPVLTRR